jgi:hypothetical protein
MRYEKERVAIRMPASVVPLQSLSYAYGSQHGLQRKPYALRARYANGHTKCVAPLGMGASIESYSSETFSSFSLSI